MKASIHLTSRWMPEDTYHKALKAEAEVVDGNASDLLWDLALHRYVLQRVVDALWDLDNLPRKSQLHQLFYPMLRKHSFRAHVARNIYNYALALVKAAKSNDSNKPRIRRLFARLDYQDARVELEKGVVRIILRNKWYTLKLRHKREYIERFKNMRWKEVHIRYENRKIFISIVFEVKYNPYVPKGFTAVDLNLRTVTVFNGSEARRYKTRFVEALGKRARAEELQGKYPERWRYNKKILNRVRALHRKARNIINDYCWKLAREIVAKAHERRYAVVLEDLEYLKESVNGKSSGVRWKLAFLAYRRFRHAVISKSIEYDIPIIVVDPRNTSSTCPRCGSRLVYVNRLAICETCGFKRDRDFVGAMNIWLRALKAYAGEPGSPQRAPAVKDEARRSRGITNEGMKQVIRSIQK